MSWQSHQSLLHLATTDYLQNLFVEPSSQARLGGEPNILRRLTETKTVEQIAQKTLELRIELANPPSPVAHFDPPIEDAFKQMPLMPMFEKRMINRILKEAGWHAVDIGSLLRATKATLDNSFLRQAKLIAAGHPILAWQMNTASWQSILSQKHAEAEWQAIIRRPWMQYYEDIRIETGIDPLRLPSFAVEKGTARWRTAEEFGFPGGRTFISRWTAKLPHIKPFERGFNTGTNRGVAGLLDLAYAQALRRSEKIASGEVKLKEGEAFSIRQEIKDYMGFCADSIQRATLPKPAQGLAPVFNAFFFAARSKLARFLFPRHLVSSNPRVRAEAWREFIATNAIFCGILFLGEWLGLWVVEKDPRSAEFMSARIGNTRIDPWAGYRQFVVLYARLVAGTGVASITGAEYEVNKLGALQSFFRTSLAPLPGILLDFWTGRNFLGAVVDITDSKEWVKRLAPFLVEDIWEAFGDGGWGRAGAVAIPAIYGEGVQTYTGDWVENWARLGLRKYLEHEEPHYDTQDFWADTAFQFKGVDPDTLTKKKGYPLYIRKVAEALIILGELDIFQIGRASCRERV